MRELGPFKVFKREPHSFIPYKDRAGSVFRTEGLP